MRRCEGEKLFRSVLHNDGSNVEATLKVKIWQQRPWRTGLSVLRIGLEVRGIETGCPLMLEIHTPDPAEAERTSDDSSPWSIARGWIETCSCTHDLCQNEFTGFRGSPKPSVSPRLLEIIQGR